MQQRSEGRIGTGLVAAGGSYTSAIGSVGVGFNRGEQHESITKTSANAHCAIPPSSSWSWPWTRKTTGLCLEL